MNCYFAVDHVTLEILFFRVSVFVYNRYQQNVLEVNQTDYLSCNSDHFLHNWTRGAGRDVVPLNETRSYYFISGNGFCFGGMKLAVDVQNPPPPPSASPVKNTSPVLLSTFRSQALVPALITLLFVLQNRSAFLRLFLH